MSTTLYPSRNANPEFYSITGYAVGSTNAITAVAGAGWTIAYTSTGIFTVTMTPVPVGTYLGTIATLMSTTQADVKQFSVVPGAYSAGVIAFKVYDASGNLANLTATEWLKFQIDFANIAVASVI